MSRYNRSIAKVIFMILQTLTARRFEIASLTFAITLIMEVHAVNYMDIIKLCGYNKRKRKSGSHTSAKNQMKFELLLARLKQNSTTPVEE